MCFRLFLNDKKLKKASCFLRLGNYIRIDYDEQGQEEYYHSFIHMHIGTAKDTLSEYSNAIMRL